MNIEQLQTLWKTQPLAPALDETEQLLRTEEESRAFDRTIRRRDLWELLAAVLLAGMYGFGGGAAKGPLLAKIAAMLVVLAVPLFAIVARRRLKPLESSSGAADLRTALEHGIRHTRLQVRLLRSVVWWYLLPIWGSTLLMEWHRHGEVGSPRWLKIQLLAVLPVFLGISWLNRYVARKSLQPRLERLLALRREWEQLSAATTPDSDLRSPGDRDKLSP